jgi:hypothetical protein
VGLSWRPSTKSDERVAPSVRYLADPALPGTLRKSETTGKFWEVASSSIKRSGKIE